MMDDLETRIENALIEAFKADDVMVSFSDHSIDIRMDSSNFKKKSHSERVSLLKQTLNKYFKAEINGKTVTIQFH